MGSGLDVRFAAKHGFTFSMLSISTYSHRRNWIRLAQGSAEWHGVEVKARRKIIWFELYALV